MHTRRVRPFRRKTSKIRSGYARRSCVFIQGPLPIHQVVRIVTWNCMSVFPQHFDDWNNPDVNLDVSLSNNVLRYSKHVKQLQPYFIRLNQAYSVSSNPLDAICLQEVDVPLVQMLVKVIQKKYPNIRVNPPKLVLVPYVKRTIASFTLGYHFLTFVHKDRITSISTDFRPYGRFAITPLDTFTLINAHISWVRPIIPDMNSQEHHTQLDRHNKNIKIVQAMRHQCERYAYMRKGIPVIICGDLNVSSSGNRKIYTDVFNMSKWNNSDQQAFSRSLQLQAIGESYNVKPENIKGLTTFRKLGKDPDDGILCDRRWALKTICTSIRNNKLPVDTEGFLSQNGDDIAPSDHAQTEVIFSWKKQPTT